MRLSLNITDYSWPVPQEDPLPPRWLPGCGAMGGLGCCRQPPRSWRADPSQEVRDGAAPMCGCAAGNTTGWLASSPLGLRYTPWTSG